MRDPELSNYIDSLYMTRVGMCVDHGLWCNIPDLDDVASVSLGISDRMVMFAALKVCYIVVVGTIKTTIKILTVSFDITKRNSLALRAMTHSRISPNKPSQPSLTRSRTRTISRRTTTFSVSSKTTSTVPVPGPGQIETSRPRIRTHQGQIGKIEINTRSPLLRRKVQKESLFKKTLKRNALLKLHNIGESCP